MRKLELFNKNDFIQKRRHTIYNRDFIHLLKIIRKLQISYPTKSYYKRVIPLNIFQTWHTKNLPTIMNYASNMIKYNNPEFNYYLFDDEDCRNFIKENFDNSVLNAYDSLIPGAYKADLWRYCVLYKKGGIYLDIKYIPENNFKFMNLIEKEHFVLDADRNGVYNALMVCLPGNTKLLACINKIVENVRNKFYGLTPLDPTGPLLLKKYFTHREKLAFDMYHDYYKNFNNRFIYFNNIIVFKQYNGYLNEYNTNSKVGYYGNLWNSRQIYK